MKSPEEIARVIDLVESKVREYRETALMGVSRRRDPYQVLVSCIISLRTRDETTAKVSKRLFEIARTPEEMVKLSLKELGNLIRPSNYYITKARNILGISHILIEDHDSRVPETIEELVMLPGVGRKTANIVMVFGHGKMGMPVDTHVHRISNRLGWVCTKVPNKTEQELRKLVPRTHWMKFNDVFVTFGQNICKPLRPLCEQCPVTEYCDLYERNVLPGNEVGKR